MLNFSVILKSGVVVSSCCKTKLSGIELDKCPGCGAALHNQYLSLTDQMSVTVWTDFYFWDNGPESNVRLTRLGKKYMLITDLHAFLPRAKRGQKKQYQRSDILWSKVNMATAVLEGEYQPKGIYVIYKEVKEIISFNPKTGKMFYVSRENGKTIGTWPVKYRMFAYHGIDDVKKKFYLKCIEYASAHNNNVNWEWVKALVVTDNMDMIPLILRYPTIVPELEEMQEQGINQSQFEALVDLHGKKKHSMTLT